MAEYVERKFTAAKLSVALAIAAVLGGLAARDQSAGATSADKSPTPHMAPGSIDSTEVKNESLLFKDFKPGQVYSDNQVNQKFLKISDAKVQYLKLDQASDIFVKGEDANKTFVKIEDANNTFVKGEDANATFLKIQDAKDQYVEGDGSVLTGFAASAGGATVSVLEVPGFVRTQGLPPLQQGPRARLTNLGSTPLHFAFTGGGGTGVIAPGASTDVNLPGAGGGSATVQLIAEGSTPTVGTLTVSGILIGQTINFSAQILVGL
jgi:hypothetical protein